MFTAVKDALLGSHTSPTVTLNLGGMKLCQYLMLFQRPQLCKRSSYGTTVLNQLYTCTWVYNNHITKNTRYIIPQISYLTLPCCIILSSVIPFLKFNKYVSNFFASSITVHKCAYPIGFFWNIANCLAVLTAFLISLPFNCAAARCCKLSRIS